MILTKAAIEEGVRQGEIHIDPFDAGCLNPNSYNYHLGDALFQVVSHDVGGSIKFSTLPLPLLDKRWLLRRGCLYLATTMEKIGSRTHVVSLIGRSSIGRLGLFVQVSANIGHQGALHCWTLELRPAISIFLYPGQPIGQVSFWKVMGDPIFYEGLYGFSDEALPTSWKSE
jgi:dCTP deaminase